MRYKLKVPRFILCFFVFDFLLAAIYLIAFGFRKQIILFGKESVYGYVKPFAVLWNLFDLGREVSIPTWYSSIQLFVVASLLIIFAYAKVEKKHMASWVLVFLPLVFVALSVDEIVQIHEWLGIETDIFLPGGSRKNTPFHITGIWMFVIGIPFFIMMLSLVFYLKRYVKVRPNIIKKYIVGLIVFLVSACALDLLSNFTISRTPSLLETTATVYAIQVCFEELGEMVGVTIIMWATYDLLISYNISLHFSTTNTNRLI